MDRDREAQIRRIEHFETMLEEVRRALSRPGVTKKELAALRDRVDALGSYYGGEDWKRDLADDEAGLLPRELRRGVLSEDGVYNVLETYREKWTYRRKDEE